MGQVIWILIPCVSIGVGIGTGFKFFLAMGVMMYLLPLGVAVLYYLKERQK